MVELNDIAADLDLVENGKWFTYYKDFAVRWASSQNPDFQKALVKAGASARKTFRSDSAMLSEHLAKQRDRLAIVHLCKDWRGARWEGQDLPFSIDNALKIFLDRRFASLKVWMWDCVGDDGEYVAEEQENLGKDSENA